MSVIWNQFCIDKSRWERESCPLSGIEKRPPLGGYVSIKVMLDTIRNTVVVRCSETVLFSEGPLSEARLYMGLAIVKVVSTDESYLCDNSTASVNAVKLVENPEPYCS